MNDISLDFPTMRAKVSTIDPRYQMHADSVNLLHSRDESPVTGIVNIGVRYLICDNRTARKISETNGSGIYVRPEKLRLACFLAVKMRVEQRDDSDGTMKVKFRELKSILILTDTRTRSRCKE